MGSGVSCGDSVREMSRLTEGTEGLIQLHGTDGGREWPQICNKAQHLLGIPQTDNLSPYFVNPSEAA